MTNSCRNIRKTESLSSSFTLSFHVSVMTMLLLSCWSTCVRVEAWTLSRQPAVLRATTAPWTIGTSTTTTTTTTTRRWMASTQEEETTTAATTTTTTSQAESPLKEKQQQQQQRLSAANMSLDLRTITSSLPTVLSHLQARQAAPEALQAAEQIAAAAAQRSSLIQERDGYLNQRKQASATVGQLMRTGEDNLDESQQAELEQAKETSTTAAAAAEKVEAALAELQTNMDTMLAGIPNLLDDITPTGVDESDNEEVYKWGDIDALPKTLEWTDDFAPRWHDDVATTLGGYQAEAAVSMSGARFVALSGDIARLERAIGMYFMDLHTSKGYTEMSVPLVVSRSTLEGTSQLPKFEEDLFAITSQSHTCNGEDAFLIPTAEVPVTNLHRGAVLEEADLPLAYVAWTPCFRAEAGSYGRDTKGLIRTHQFQKVELVKITTPETSADEHEAMTADAEACLQALDLPYRKVRLCSGDIGFAARHCYDLEVWLPGAGEYREISSVSNCGDFQAQRMGLRYRPAPANTDDTAGGGNKKPKKAKPVLCHTMNGSGLAVGRTLVAVLENYQRPDGSVVVPKVLQPYMGGKEVLEPPSKK